jgi:hypothetical protein
MTRNKHGWWLLDFDVVDEEVELPIDGRQRKHKFRERNMKKALTLIASVVLVAGAARAQTPTGQVIVSQFSNWSVPGTVALASGANTAIPFSPCSVSGANKNFQAFSTSAPIKIVDSNNPSIDEVVTPSTVVLAPGNCTVTFTTVNAHPIPYSIVSGSAGLQEAVNANALSTAQNTAVLDSAFYAKAASIGGGAAVIHAATASPTLSLLDLTQAPNVAYQSVSSVYTAYSNTGGAAPTAAAGAAAGTSPTGPTNVGNGNTFTVSLTTGSATTTGTLFTETWPSTLSFGRVPNVTVVSTGANVPVFTYTVTGSSTHVLTVTMASAPPTATAYTFQVSAQ